MNNPNLQRLQEKLIRDFESFQNEALAMTKEQLWRSSYIHAIGIEWQFWLNEWFVEADEEEDMPVGIETLLKLDNVFDDLVDKAYSLDTLHFSGDSFDEIFEDFIKERERNV